MTATPPPIPNSIDVPPAVTAAARAALIAPLVLLGLRLAALSLEKGEQSATSTSVRMIVGAAALLLILVGFGSALYALAAMPRGSRGILGRAVSGLLLNGGFLLLFVFGFVGGFQKERQNRANAKAQLEQLRSVGKDLQADMRRQLEEDGEITSTSEQMERLQNQFKQAGEKLSGPQKAILEAGAAYTRNLQLESEKYAKAMEAFQAAEVLNASKLSSLETIAAKRRVVENFMTVNANLKAYLADAPNRFEKELQARGIQGRQLQEVLTGFNRSATKRQPLLMDIRNCDDQLGRAALSSLALLETHWGKWRVDADTQQLIMSDDKLIEQYNGFMEEINQIAEKQTEAQRKLLAIE